jgi:hypothetical protein
MSKQKKECMWLFYTRTKEGDKPFGTKLCKQPYKTAMWKSLVEYATKENIGYGCRNQTKYI